MVFSLRGQSAFWGIKYPHLAEFLLQEIFITSFAEAGALPPHLREICRLLALGLLRLRRRAAEDLARDTALQARDLGESSLHSPPSQSGHATPKRRPA